MKGGGSIDREAIENTLGLKNRIIESSCRFLQLIAGVDSSLFSDCIRHSLLGSYLMANMAAYSAYKNMHTTLSRSESCSDEAVYSYTDGRGRGYGDGNVSAGDARGLIQSRIGGVYDDDENNNQDEFVEGDYEMKMSEWGGKGGFASFSAQSDLLCVILRAETSSRPSVSSRDADHECGGFSSSIPQYSCLSFSKTVQILDPQIPVKVFKAVTCSLKALTSALSSSLSLSLESSLSLSPRSQSEKKVRTNAVIFLTKSDRSVNILIDLAYSNLFLPHFPYLCLSLSAILPFPS